MFPVSAAHNVLTDGLSRSQQMANEIEAGWHTYTTKHKSEHKA